MTEKARHRLTTMLMLLLAAAVLPTRSVAQHVVVLGDSNTWLGGDDCSKPRGWNTWFKQAFKPTSCRSYARSGATWTNTTETRRNTQENTGVLGNDNVMYNQIERLKEACERGEQAVPELIILAAGTNDAWFAKERPGAFDVSVGEAFLPPTDSIVSRPAAKVCSLAESVRYGCELLRTAFPDARLVLLTPLQTTAAPAELIAQAGDIIEACAERLQAQAIRMDRESCVKAEAERVKRRYTYDGTHTSEAGARQNGLLVAKRLKEIYNKY